MSRLYYTKADIQHRRWQIADCLAKKGAHICCEIHEGNDVSACEYMQLQLANAYMDIICSYEPLAPHNYAGEENLDEINVISEEQLDKIFAWFQNYCCVNFLPKETAPADEEGNLSLFPIEPQNSPCCLALENGGLILLESNEAIALELTTCLLASDQTLWDDYYNNFDSFSFYNNV
jgi:hypothetical protein